MNDNKSLWKFQLEWIAPAPRWVPQIEVVFDIDANGILTVKAKDKWTWKEQKITISGTGWLDKNEVDRLVQEAELKREEDKKKKEWIEIKNNAESTIYQSEKFIKDNSDKINNENKELIENWIQELKSILFSEDINEIQNKTKVLSEILMKVWQELYSKQDNTSNNEQNMDNSVIDGEVEK
jgi:molecular chaperone DnaK